MCVNDKKGKPIIIEVDQSPGSFFIKSLCSSCKKNSQDVLGGELNSLISIKFEKYIFIPVIIYVYNILCKFNTI